MKTKLNDCSSYPAEADYAPDHQISADITSKKSEWVSPQLTEHGNLSFVIKGISYNPLDGLANLTA